MYTDSLLLLVILYSQVLSGILVSGNHVFFFYITSHARHMKIGLQMFVKHYLGFHALSTCDQTGKFSVSLKMLFDSTK